MTVKRLNIINYKCFHGKFTIDFNKGINIIVGKNESGKSTILEAINLCLTGILDGKYLLNTLSEYLFNYQTSQEYIRSLKTENKQPPPDICIEVFFEDKAFPQCKGTGNSERKSESGIVLKVEFDEESYKAEYEEYIKSEEIITIPIEYYKITWMHCGRDSITARSIPIKSVLIDSTAHKYQNGSDIYISRIIRNVLSEKEKVELSQAYRSMKQNFIENESVEKINEEIQEKTKLSHKKIKISADLPTQNAWENSLMTYIDEIPFHHIGKGEQCIIKTNLALSHQKANEANLILIEEPENHLSHTRLSELIKNIQEHADDKQLIITTHSSFVANKLLLKNLILLNNRIPFRFSDLKPDTYEFFKKLPGYPTLRFLFGKKAVLVEGDSDELIFQKAYMATHSGKLPIEDGIDVISVKLSFKRFLEIASIIDVDVAVITDNDGDYDTKITKKYSDYTEKSNIAIFADSRNDLNTLEPQFLDANKGDLEDFCDKIGIKKTKYDDFEKIKDYMVKNKTKWALKVFESSSSFLFPDYINRAVRWCSNE